MLSGHTGLRLAEGGGGRCQGKWVKGLILIIRGGGTLI